MMVDKTLCINHKCKAKGDCHNYIGFHIPRKDEWTQYQYCYTGGIPKADGSCEDLSLWKSQE